MGFLLPRQARILFLLTVLVGRVGLEPTKPEVTDLQSAVIATIRPTQNKMAGDVGIEPTLYGLEPHCCGFEDRYASSYNNPLLKDRCGN